jgi:hypothetical protein
MKFKKEPEGVNPGSMQLTSQPRHWPLWVTSSLSASYQSDVCFRVHTGNSEANFSRTTI